MSSFRTLDDLDLAGKRVLLRVDMNVPMRDGVVTDPARIEKIVPTITEILAAGAGIVLASHFGRPKGKVVPEMSLEPLAKILSSYLDTDVLFSADGAHVAQPGEVVLLENLRFNAGEEGNDPDFAESLAAHGDIYVNDAFSCAHRAHASIDGVARLLPAAAGRLMQQELEALGNALENPAHPVAALVGGNKISTKLGVLENLITKVDHLIVGGAMANTFLFAAGIAVGKSLCEEDMAATAKTIIAKAKATGCEIHLPVDAVVAGALAAGTDTATVAIDAVPEDQMILDVGPETAAAISALLDNCKTLVWNGPLGAFEFEPFDQGTNAAAQAAAKLTQAGTLLSVAGGGDTMAALANAGVSETFSYISSAGGAFLEWLEGKTLPGIAVLMEE
ncbi:MAG: phosphoglycerate kinase [Rhodospirillaceae bacterium]|nr:phosphoglycerate kinase [Rhodospirillaceae bacterium]